MIAESNPLLVDLIIEHLVYFLPEKDLKSLRLVCWKFYVVSTRALQKLSKPIAFGDLYKGFDLIRLRPDLETIKLFLSTMSSSEMLPYVKFDLKPIIFAPNNLHILEEFLKRFGPRIEHLTISMAYESSDSFTKNCFPFLNLSHLKSLEFCNTIRGELRPNLQTELFTTRYNLLESLLTASPNLADLSLWCDSENLVWPSEAIEVLRQAQLPKLRKLKVSFPMTNYSLVNLSRLKQIQLTSFIFLIREPIFNTESFYRILDSQKTTLQNLKLIDLQCDQEKFVEFPIMAVLRQLEIEGTFYGFMGQFNLVNFSFRRVPCLESLILRNCHSQNFNLKSLFSLTTQCYSLKEFHVTLAHNFVNEGWLKEMPKMFPNLENLHIMFSPEAMDLLTCIFQYLKSLKYLIINVRKCGENLDSLLTGIPSQIIWTKDLLPAISSKFGEMESSHLKLKAGLYDLKNLKYLEVKGEHKNYRDTTAITDISAYLAFLQTKKLRHLSLYHSGDNLSKECLETLKRKMHVVQIRPND